MQITVRCPVFPTEKKVCVDEAISNILGDIKLEEYESDGVMSLIATASDRVFLNELRHTIHELRIIDAARSRLYSNWDDSQTIIHFDKQAAFIGKLRLLDDSHENPPLGSIEVIIEMDDLEEFEKFISWFVPPTKNGRIVRN